MNILESPSRTCAFVWFHADSGQRLSKGIYRISGFCALTLRVAGTGQTYWLGLSTSMHDTSIISRAGKTVPISNIPLNAQGKHRINLWNTFIEREYIYIHIIYVICCIHEFKLSIR